MVRSKKVMRYLAKWVPTTFLVNEMQWRFPQDTDFVLRWVDQASDDSFERALLELLAMKMSPSKRQCLLGPGSSTDMLYSRLREPRFPDSEGYWCRGHYYLALKHRWYNETRTGRAETLDGLFQLISANPQCFCNLLK
ncbi:expressed unknown protein [Seminavis robusta]|uniref:Uncharacterized protein n=1 Tax=Seminavis robusta TaxID=568900 RepID=A0A9N8HF91_9STRA|nr:expressed unknown protein [Seminavis robusta]|eukprot:Sro513_g157800.1 n/a (138) ;mRNA; r:21779-22192